MRIDRGVKPESVEENAIFLSEPGDSFEAHQRCRTGVKSTVPGIVRPDIDPNIRGHQIPADGREFSGRAIVDMQERIRSDFIDGAKVGRLKKSGVIPRIEIRAAHQRLDLLDKSLGILASERDSLSVGLETQGGLGGKTGTSDESHRQDEMESRDASREQS